MRELKENVRMEVLCMNEQEKVIPVCAECGNCRFWLCHEGAEKDWCNKICRITEKEALCVHWEKDRA